MIIFIVSSPYLLVFNDNRVRNTREQMMLQVDLVRRRSGAGLVLGEEFLLEFYYAFGIKCKILYYQI